MLNFQAKRMPPITMPEAITPSAKRSLTSSSTAFVNPPMYAPVFKVSSFSTLSAVVPGPVSLPCSWRGKFHQRFAYLLDLPGNYCFSVLPHSPRDSDTTFKNKSEKTLIFFDVFLSAVRGVNQSYMERSN